MCAGRRRTPCRGRRSSQKRETSSLRYRYHPGTGGPKYVLQNRDVIKMFDGLTVSESFLLKSSTREILLRKRP